MVWYGMHVIFAHMHFIAVIAQLHMIYTKFYRVWIGSVFDYRVNLQMKRLRRRREQKCRARVAEIAKTEGSAVGYRQILQRMQEGR